MRCDITREVLHLASGSRSDGLSGPGAAAQAADPFGPQSGWQATASTGSVLPLGESGPVYQSSGSHGKARLVRRYMLVMEDQFRVAILRELHRDPRVRSYRPPVTVPGGVATLRGDRR